MKSNSNLKLIYKFDPNGIPDWQERLTSAYEMLFQKIEEMEERRLVGAKMEGKDYGGQIIPQL